jgi:hypothetical protein
MGKLSINPVSRTLYNATLSIFPGCFLVVAASSYIFISAICAVLFVNRKKFQKNKEEDLPPEPNVFITTGEAASIEAI